MKKILLSGVLLVILAVAGLTWFAFQDNACPVDFSNFKECMKQDLIEHYRTERPGNKQISKEVRNKIGKDCAQKVKLDENIDKLNTFQEKVCTLRLLGVSAQLGMEIIKELDTHQPEEINKQPEGATDNLKNQLKAPDSAPAVVPADSAPAVVAPSASGAVAPEPAEPAELAEPSSGPPTTGDSVAPTPLPAPTKPQQQPQKQLQNQQKHPLQPTQIRKQPAPQPTPPKSPSAPTAKPQQKHPLQPTQIRKQPAPQPTPPKSPSVPTAKPQQKHPLQPTQIRKQPAPQPTPPKPSNAPTKPQQQPQQN